MAALGEQPAVDEVTAARTGFDESGGDKFLDGSVDGIARKPEFMCQVS